MNYVIKNHEDLLKKFGAEETLKAYDGNMEEIAFLYSQEAFIMGFRLGLKLAVESLV